MARFADLPTELIILICENLENTKNLLRLALTSHRMRKIILSGSDLERIFLRELRDGVAKRCRLEKAVNSSKSTLFAMASLRALWAIYTTDRSFRPNVLPTAIRLAGLYEDSERVEEAITLLNSIWTSEPREMSVPPNTIPLAVRLSSITPVAVKLADLYQKVNRDDDALDILETAWAERAQYRRISLSATPIAIRLAGLYKSRKDDDQAIKVLEKAWASSAIDGSAPLDCMPLAANLEKLYRDNERVDEAIRIRGTRWTTRK